jgi:hypothetical protein
MVVTAVETSTSVALVSYILSFLVALMLTDSG